MNKIVCLLLSLSFTYSNDFICNENSKEFYCNEEFQNMNIKDKIAQMIMVRVRSDYYSSDNYYKKNGEYILNIHFISFLLA